MEFGRFFLPGPTEVRPEVLAAMQRPMIGHRGEGLKRLFATLQEGLRLVFRTDRPVLVAASSATAMMEMGVRALPPGPILALVNGAFSERFLDIAEASGREAHALEVEWGFVHDPIAVRARLKDTRYAGMTLVHSETSTGALQPLAALAETARGAGIPVVVDAVTSLAAAPVETDAWQLDYVCAGSQKALALPPGLGLAAAAGAFVENASGNEGRGVYLDLVRYAEAARANQTPFTPALPLLFALEAQLGRISREGVERRCQRHREMAERTWEWAGERGLPVLAPQGARSPSVTCLRLPERHTGPEVVRRLRERGFTIAAGYGRLKETTIRIGHMGDHTAAELDALLESLGKVID